MRLDSQLWPYDITGPLGASARAEVYRAHDTRLGQVVVSIRWLTC